MLYLKSGPEILAALNKGVIDAGVISAPMTLKAPQAGVRTSVDVPGRNIPMIHSALGTTRESSEGASWPTSGISSGIYGSHQVRADQSRRDKARHWEIHQDD